MAKKKSVRIALVLLTAALLAVTVTVLAETFSKTDAPEDADIAHRVSFDGYSVFVDDSNFLIRSDVSCHHLTAYAGPEASSAFLASLAKLDFRRVEEEERLELVDSGWFRKFMDETYYITIVDKDYNEVMNLFIFRNSDTGEWCRAINVFWKVNGEIEGYLVISPEESFDGEVLDRIVDSAFGGDSKKYQAYVKEKSAKHELTREGLIEDMPNTDYHTYEEIEDKINYDYSNPEAFAIFFGE